MHIAITGASSGIGEGLARQYGGADNKLTLVARRGDRLRDLAESLAAETLVCSADLSVLDTACDWIDEAVSKHGPIDLLINNAGMQYVEAAQGVSDERAETLLRLNLLVPIRLTRRVLPSMLERGRGAVVNISSVAGVIFPPAMAHYCASKAGLAAYSEVLSAELLGTGVHVLTVYPGPVSTPMERAAVDQLEDSWGARNAPTGSVEGIARAIESCVDRRQARLFYPRSYRLTRYFGALAQWVANRFTPGLRAVKPAKNDG